MSYQNVNDGFAYVVQSVPAGNGENCVPECHCNLPQSKMYGYRSGGYNAVDRCKIQQAW